MYTLTENLPEFCLCPEVLQATMIKNSEQTELREEISTLFSVQTVTWTLLDSFRQIYSEAQEKREGLTDQKYLKVNQK